MNDMTPPSQTKSISAVPTNIITGFLGVGKTTAILHLLANKPKHERWAVLVNEFGEIGVDGGLFQGQHSEAQQVFVREVPGGCMCCTAGLPMQFALNQLLAQANPDRLLIEPTGLGHPVEILQTLSSTYYQEILSLQKIVTLVDARKLSDQRYTGHATFNQQIEIADVVIGNKEDLYQAEDRERLADYLEPIEKAKGDGNQVTLHFAKNGVIDPTILEGATTVTVKQPDHHHHAAVQNQNVQEPLPESGLLKAVNEGEGFRSVGWRFSPDYQFDRAKLFHFFHGLDAVERLKGVFITASGIFGYNLTEDGLTEMTLDECDESCVEIIATQLSDEWEAEILACVVA